MIRNYKNSGFAGEMFVAAELSRRGYEVLLGNVGTKKTVGVDLAAVDPETCKTISISVKSLKKPNAFLIDPEKVRPDAIYIFVITNDAGEMPDFFILKGSVLLANEMELWKKWGRDYLPKHGRGIYCKSLLPWKDNWAACE
jgi:hypothetical protein